MLPKVATHILHSTSRAAASLHHQASIRNVLQLQTSSGPSSSTHLVSWSTTPGSSNWGGSSSSSGGASSGSAKYGSGRFYYNGAGRAVAQANTTTTNDGTFYQSDETEEPPLRTAPVSVPKKSRLRSNSLSIPSQGRSERGEKLGVLRTVQLHARSKHTFTPNSSILPQTSPELIESEDAPSRPVLVRRNSTSSPPLPESTLPPTRPSSPIRHNSTVATSHTDADVPPLLHASNPEVTRPPTPPSQTVQPPAEPEPLPKSSELLLLEEAMATGQVNPDDVAIAARTLLASTSPLGATEYNVALAALMKNRRPGDGLHEILETYNDMLRRQVAPTGWTYRTLLQAFVTRDHEIQTVVHALRRKIKVSGAQVSQADQQRLETLERENNFTSAMSVFEALLQIDANASLGAPQYTSLLSSCANHSALDSAKHVWAQSEARRPDILPSPPNYTFFIQAHINAGDLDGAVAVFDRFKVDLASGRVYTHEEPARANRSLIQVWNQMIECYFRFNQPDKAVGILEQMMDVTIESATLQTAPPVSTSTFTVLLAGFLQTGDVKTALSWFERLLAQPAASTHDPYHPIGFPTKPDASAWSLMIEGLGGHKMVDELNQIYARRASSEFKQNELSTIFVANIASLSTLASAEVMSRLQFLITEIVPKIKSSHHANCISQLSEAYVSRGMYTEALDVFLPFARAQLASSTSQSTPQVLAVQSMQLRLSQQLYDKTQGTIPFSVPLELARLAAEARVIQPAEHTVFFLQSYGASRRAGVLPTDMTLRDWELLLYAAVEVETAAIDGAPVHTEVANYAFEGLTSLLGDLASKNVSVDSMDNNLVQRIAQLVVRLQSAHIVQPLFAKLSPSFSGLLSTSESTDSAADSRSDSGYSSGSAAASERVPAVKIDVALTKAMNGELRKSTPTAGVMAAYELFCKGIENNRAPNPAVLGLMIQNLGRINRIEEVQHAYSVAQVVLQSLESKKTWQMDSWFNIEDSMVIALAHHGDVDGAHLHRLRILEYGRAPSADAYGALIYNVKDTTDDASNALALFQESQQQKVQANGYLYNNIISKLARARKADHALELFQQMKATSIVPTSVTYGAVIGACARVGDVASAEALFAEMVASKNFKPRVPPYNTMIQMYTTTKPSREMALHYYDELLKANIRPSAYTYKLLMDAYGSIEPVDIRSMEEVFKKIKNDPEIAVQGNHYSSAINAYGCVQKNLDKAIEVFDSIPAGLQSRLADAVVFEAMINALVANRRTDLIPQYVERMKAVGVHMTAYIANFLIKGYALAGDMEQARQMFESLEDPAEGVAAPNNHAPHDPSHSPAVDVAAPVYREPSTWEAMVRAELGCGNRQGALDLLERLRARQYPEAVFNRISGIMVDHSLVFP